MPNVQNDDRHIQAGVLILFAFLIGFGTLLLAKSSLQIQSAEDALEQAKSRRIETVQRVGSIVATQGDRIRIVARVPYTLDRIDIYEFRIDPSRTLIWRRDAVLEDGIVIGLEEGVPGDAAALSVGRSIQVSLLPTQDGFVAQSVTYGDPFPFI